VYADGDRLAGGLVLGDTLDVDDIFETVDGDDLAFATLVGASDYGDFVVLSDGDRSDLENMLGELGNLLSVYEHCTSHGALCSRAHS
jgi:hypothetical protein